MQTSCVRQGQIEVGIIENEGREFSALGATVQGRSITGYTKSVGKLINTTSWCGKTMLAARCEVVERFWSGSLALMFRLPRGRFIVGYALGESGMLFRGELLIDCDEAEARHHALMLSECFAQLDAEDEEAFNAEAEEERMLDIEYRCPDCDHEWQEQWSCACDSQCPNCGLKNVLALSWSDSAE
jgi:DNA-directed RNA polymerase subunit RPC12/RpoP